jgi:hypothetical protein
MKEHIKKLVCVGITIIVFSLLMMSGPMAMVNGEITSPTAGEIFLERETVSLTASLTASSGDVINFTAENVSFVIQTPLGNNVTINASDITISGSNSSNYSFNPSTGSYAYLYGYSNNVYLNAGYTTETTGTYLFYADVDYVHVDDLGNWEDKTYSDTQIFEVKAEVPGGGAGGYVTPQSYYQLESTGTFEKCVVVGDDISFNAGTTTHHITIISLTSESVTLEVSSNPIKVLIPVGETKFFDIDDDGWYDISIHVKSVSAGKACLTIETFAKKIVETAAPETAPTITAEYKPPADTERAQIVGESTNVSTGIVPLQSGIISVIVIGALAIGAYIVFKLNKGRKHRR